MTDSDYEPPCARKIGHEDEGTAAMAMQIAKEISGGDGRGANTYLCPHCGKWHWGHTWQKPKAKRRERKRHLRSLKKYQNYWKNPKGR